MSKKEDLLKKSCTFCMMPWVHMHALPNGNVYPCCYGTMSYIMGNLRQNTMEEVWNNQRYKDLRYNMLNEKKSIPCRKCYDNERVGIYSLRQSINQSHGKYIDSIDLTDEDGTLNEFKLRYWDVRFSNLCNFSCRTCGPAFSSKWYKDYVDHFKRKPTNPDGTPMNVIEYAGRNKNDILDQMENHLPFIDQIYFAGGEPLIMEEHYLILEKLIKLGRTDINIQYNTNFSELVYKKTDVIELWKQFENVSIGASLDASGKRAELMRKGTDWKQIIRNRERMMKETPHVDFYINATLSAMNSYHILDFHKEWVSLGFIEPKDFNVNVLYSPEWHRLTIIPEDVRQNDLIPRYIDHIKWLMPNDSYSRATTGFNGAINFMKDEDKSNLIEQFNFVINELDGPRQENFWEVFPELGFLKNE